MNLRLPTFSPPVLAIDTALPQHFHPNEEPQLSGINTSTVLQHPGFYYYKAASCTARRRDRFLAVLEQEVCEILAAF